MTISAFLPSVRAYPRLLAGRLLGRPSSIRAFSLVEILVALGIIVVSTLPAMLLMSQGTRSVDSSGRRLLMGQCARLVIEDLKTRGYDNIVSRPWASISSDPDTSSPFHGLINRSDSAAGLRGLDAPNFSSLHNRLSHTEYELDVNDDSPTAGMKTVTVRFREKLPRRVSVWTFSTIVKNDPF